MPLWLFIPNLLVLTFKIDYYLLLFFACCGYNVLNITLVEVTAHYCLNLSHKFDHFYSEVSIGLISVRFLAMNGCNLSILFLYWSVSCLRCELQWHT